MESILKSARYVVRSSVAAPDYKRPCVHRRTQTFQKEASAYRYILEQMEQIFDYSGGEDSDFGMIREEEVEV